MAEKSASEEPTPPSDGSGQEFAFISVTGKPGRVDARTRRKIRSHVRADHHRRYPHERRHQAAVDINATPLLDRSLQNLPGRFIFANHSVISYDPMC